jgi:hypothetical protein
MMGPRDTAVYGSVVVPRLPPGWSQLSSITSWDAVTGAQTAVVGRATVPMEGFSLSPDEQLALMRHRGGSTSLWDMASGTRIGFDSRYVTPTWGTLADGGRYFVSVGPGYTSWELPSGVVRSIEFPADAPAVDFARGPGALVAIDAFDSIEIRDVRTSEVVRRVETVTDFSPVRFTRSGVSFATVGTDGRDSHPQPAGSGTRRHRRLR